MTAETHSQIANFIWSICNLLRGPYKRNEYRKVILPLTVLRRFDCILAPTKAQVLKEHAAIKTKGENIIRHRLSHITKVPFYNLSKFTMAKPEKGSGLNGLLDDPNHLAPNLNSYINGFSPNVRAIMERFKFGEQVAYMAEKDLLYLVIKAFTDPKIDLSPDRVDPMRWGMFSRNSFGLARNNPTRKQENTSPRAKSSSSWSISSFRRRKTLPAATWSKPSTILRAAQVACCLSPRSTSAT